jgi:hypothetical protein
MEQSRGQGDTVCTGGSAGARIQGAGEGAADAGARVKQHVRGGIGAGAGAAGTWAAPSEWREHVRGGTRELAVWAGVERPEKNGPMGTSR